MAARRLEETHEFEGTIEFTTEKSRLVETTFGERYWVPKSQTYDFNATDEHGNYMFVVSHWWWNKKDDFLVKERE